MSDKLPFTFPVRLLMDSSLIGENRRYVRIAASALSGEEPKGEHVTLSVMRPITLAQMQTGEMSK